MAEDKKISADDFNTTDLMKFLLREPDAVGDIDFDTPPEAGTLPTRLAKVMKEKKVTAAELMKRTGLSKPYIYQILDGTRLPGRDALLRIAFELNLGLQEIQRLLTCAGRGRLYPKIRRDAAIIACINKKMTAEQTEEFLESIGEEGL